MANNLEGEEMVQIWPSKYVPHLHTIIMLHDKGSNGAGCRDRLFSAKTRKLLDRPRTLDKMHDCCRWVFPDAPHPAVAPDMNASGLNVEAIAANADEDAVNAYVSAVHDAFDSNRSFARQWFDTPDMFHPSDSPGQHPALEESIKKVLAIVKKETEWVGIERIFIGGFGQGFAVAAGAMLVDGTGDFAGLIGLNGWLPFSQQLMQEMDRDMDRQPHSAWVNRARTLLAPQTFPNAPEQSCAIIRRNQIQSGRNNTPIFLAHPVYDEVVHYSETFRARDVFREMGWTGLVPYWYNNGDDQPDHGINTPQGVEDLSRWLSDQSSRCPRHPPFGHIYNYAEARILDGKWGMHSEELEKTMEDAVKQFLGWNHS